MALFILVSYKITSSFFKPSLKPESVRFEFNVRPKKQVQKIEILFI